MSFHDAYYHSQFGGGRGVPTVFVGAPRMRGHGLGSWFSGIFRSALPLLTKGARAVGKEALRAGVNILDDVTENNMNFKDAFHNRVNESGRVLKRKATDKINKLMEGSGYIHHASKRSLQSPFIQRSHRVATKKRRKQTKRGKTVKRLNSKKKKTLKKKKSKKVKQQKKKKRVGKKGSRKSNKKKVKTVDIFG